MNLFKLLLFITVTLSFADGKDLAKSLSLDPSSKAIKQWEKIFESGEKMGKMGIDKLNDVSYKMNSNAENIQNLMEVSSNAKDQIELTVKTMGETTIAMNISLNTLHKTGESTNYIINKICQINEETTNNVSCSNIISSEIKRLEHNASTLSEKLSQFRT